MYRTIKCELWNDPAVRKLPTEAKLLFLYLITNQHTHVSGIYYLPKILIQHETGLAPAQVKRGIDTLSIGHLLLYDEENEISFVVNMFDHQAKGGKLDKGAATQLESLHNSPLINDFLDRYPHVKEHLPDTLSIPHRRGIPQEQEQEQEQEQIQEKVFEAKTLDYNFEAFWREAKKVYQDVGMPIGSKAEAKTAWKRVKGITPLVGKQLERQAEAKKAIARTGKDPIQLKHLCRWIKHRCWEDEPDPVPKPTSTSRISAEIPHDFGGEA